MLYEVWDAWREACVGFAVPVGVARETRDVEVGGVEGERGGGN